MMTVSWKLPFWVCSGYCAVLCLALSAQRILGQSNHKGEAVVKAPAQSKYTQEQELPPWTERWALLLRDGKALEVLMLSAVTHLGVAEDPC